MNGPFTMGNPGPADERWEGAVAGCSLWWRNPPSIPGHRIGLIGALEGKNLGPLLVHACDRLRSEGCSLAIGPIDGSTWRSYRLVTESGDLAPFFLEPDTPPQWPAQFAVAGFHPLATYCSTVVEDLRAADPRLERIEARLGRIELRPIRLGEIERELGLLHELSLHAFRRNFLFTPLPVSEFLELYLPLAPLIVPELVQLAFAGDRLVGCVFGIPDLLESRRGLPPATAILKTLAVLPGREWAGLGNLLVARFHAAARGLGFSRVIHALMHEANVSTGLSARYGGRVIRRYTLFCKVVAASAPGASVHARHGRDHNERWPNKRLTQ